MARIVVTGAGASSDNHQPLIQQALDAVEAAGGGVVYIPDGVHYIGPANGASTNNGAHSLQLGDNVHLQLGANATLVRRSSGGGGFNATIRNKSLAGNVNVKVSGGVVKTTDSLNVGKHLGFEKVVGLAVEGVRFAGVEGDWNTAFVDCQDVVISNVVIGGGWSLYNDGLHFLGGQRIGIDNCIIHCGDDAISFTQENDPQEESLATMDLTDVVVSNCVLWSEKANALKMLVAPNQERAIRRIRVSNVVAKVGADSETPMGQGIVIADQSEANLVSDIEIDGVWIDASQNGGEVVDVDYASRVRLHRVYAQLPASRMSINASVDVELDGCVVESPRVSGSQCLFVNSCSNIRVIGGCYQNAKQHGVLISDADVFEVANTRVSGSVASGIYIHASQNGLVTGNSCRSNGGYGIIEASPSDYNAFLANYTNANSGGTLSIAGADSHNVANVS